MTVSTNDTIERYEISGAGPYAFSFRIFNDTDLTVVALSTDEPPEVVPLTYLTHYTVTGANESDGGSITLTTAAYTPYDGYTVDIRSNTPEDQPTSIRNQPRFLPEIHEDAFDYLSRQIQDLRRLVNASVRSPDNEPALAMVLPPVATRSGTYSVFDALGQPAVSSGTGSDSALRTDLASTTSGADGAALAGYRRPETGSIASSVRAALRGIHINAATDFGATAGDTGNQSTALQAAINAAAAAIAITRKVYIPGGTYRLTAQIALASNVEIIMDADTTLKMVTADTNILYGEEISNVKIRGGKFYGVASTAQNAAIEFYNCNGCSGEYLEFENFSDAAIRIGGDDTGWNIGHRFKNIRGASWTGTVVQGSALVAVTDHVDDCVIEDPYMTAESWMGIFVANEFSGAYVKNVKIVRPHFRNQLQYGMAAYRVGGVGDIDNVTVIDPNIADISGDVLSATGGAGLYFQGCTTVHVRGGTIENCNIDTVLETLAPAAIGINNVRGDHTIIGTNIRNTNWYGVMAASPGVATAKIRVMVTVSASDKFCIYGKETGGINASGSQLRPSAGVGAVGILNTVAKSELDLSDVTATVSGISAPISLTLIDDVNMNGLCVTGSGAGAFSGVSLDQCARVSQRGGVINMGSGATGAPFQISASTGVKVASVTMVNDGTSACIVTSGTCTDSHFDKSNTYGSNVFTNGGTGCQIEFRHASNPASGTYKACDTRYALTVANGGSPGAMYTSDGAWKALAAVAA